MRITSISGIFLMMFSVSVLMVTGCDNPNEKTEIIPPIQGSLLENGPVPSVTPEGAIALKEMITDISFIKQYRELFQSFAADMDEKELKAIQENISFLGEFDVLPRGDYYEVVLPERTTIRPADPEDEQVKSVQIFHDVALEVRPTGDPSAFRVKYKFGDKPISVAVNTDQGTSEVMTLSYVEGKPIEGLWHNDFQTMVQLKGSTRNAKITFLIPEQFRREFDGADTFAISAANISNDYNLVPDDNNLWSGAIKAIVNNIQIDLPQDVGGVGILKIAIEQDIQKLNPLAYREFWAGYNDLMVNAYNLEANGEEFEETILPFLKTYKNILVDGLESTTFSFKINDIATNLNKTPKEPVGQKNFHIKEVDISGDMSGMKEDKANMNLSYGVKGIDSGLHQFEEELGGEVPIALIPKNVKVSGGFSNLPIGSLMDTAIDIMEKTQGDGSEIEEALISSQDAFTELLIERGTKLNINDTYFGNDIWLLLVNGSAMLNNASPYKAVGDADVRFYGFDDLMAKMDQRMKSEKTSPFAKTYIQQAMMGMGMMQMFGQQKQDEKGRDYRGYALNVTEDGQLQMNGTDLMQMMGMAR